MAVNLNPNAVNLPAARVAARTGDEGSKARSRGTLQAPRVRADENVIPSPDLLRSLIEKAVGALKEGMYWDRGSILNLVV